MRTIIFLLLQTLILSLLQHTIIIQYANAATEVKENEVRNILQHMETDVILLRNEIERVYTSRCDPDTLLTCSEANYNDCSSTFPGQICMEPNELVVTACGDGASCNALWDKELSTVSIPSALADGPNDNPSDQEIVESACYTRLAEPYMIDKYIESEQYWEKYNVQPSWAYFGAHNGLFRKVPAILQEQCGVYDPRRRPWFVAASSGPKDVLLILDISGSMDQYGRLELAKRAAITVIETLTVADRVAIVTFSDEANVVGGFDKLIRTTYDNKQLLIQAIDELVPNGPTNFQVAFEAAFDSLDKTIRDEATSGCNIAVLFMTDGKITDGQSDVIELVNERTTQISDEFDRKTTIFTFSLGQAADHEVTRSIACSTGGIWTPVDDFTDDLIDAMSSYYKLYALGLGEGGNEDFVAWVEPYEFHNPKGKMGTTVSTPVYDRSVSPPLFLGVAAIDMYMDALEQVLDEDAASSTMLQRFIMWSTAICPSIQLSECELDALRFLGGGEEATCGLCNSSSYKGIVPEKCSLGSDLPENLWDNTDMSDLSHAERACCESGDTEPSDSCPAIDSFSEDGTSGSIVKNPHAQRMLIVVICITVISIFAIAFIIYMYSRVHLNKQTTPQIVNGTSIGAPSDTGETDTISFENGNGENSNIVERLNSISESINGGVALERINSISSTINGDDNILQALDNATRSANTTLLRGSTLSTITTVDGDSTNGEQLQLQQQNDLNEFVFTCQYLLKCTKEYTNTTPAEGKRNCKLTPVVAGEKQGGQHDDFFFVRVGRVHDGEVERVILYRQGFSVCSFGSYCREIGKRSIDFNNNKQGWGVCTFVQEISKRSTETNTSAQAEARYGNILSNISEGGLELMTRTLCQLNCSQIDGDIITLFPSGIPANYNEQQKQSDHALFQIHATKLTIQYRITSLERAVNIAKRDADIAQQNEMDEMAIIHQRRHQSSLDELKRCSSILSKLDGIELCLHRSLNDAQITKTYESLKTAFDATPGMHNASVDELMAYIRREMDTVSISDDTNADETELNAQEEGRQEVLRVMEDDLEARLNNLRRFAPPEDNHTATVPPDNLTSRQDEIASSKAAFTIYPTENSDAIASESNNIEPSENDVLCGRGWMTSNHKGNICFKDEILKLLSWYESSSKEEKSRISELLFESVKSQGNCFLEMSVDGQWHELTDNEARKMAKQALKTKQRSSRSVV